MDVRLTGYNIERFQEIRNGCQVPVFLELLILGCHSVSEGHEGRTAF